MALVGLLFAQGIATSFSNASCRSDGTVTSHADAFSGEASVQRRSNRRLRSSAKSGGEADFRKFRQPEISSVLISATHTVNKSSRRLGLVSWLKSRTTPA